MTRLQNLNASQRLGGALALLILLLGLGVGVALARAYRVYTDIEFLEETTLPSVKLVYELTVQVDDLRGLSALHLMLSGSAEILALEARLQTQRQRLAQRLVACEKQLKTAAERQHFDAVKTHLVVFWTEHDKLLAVSRRASRDPAAAAQARALLAGASQQAFLQLGAALQAWWAHAEQQAVVATRQAHADARTSLGWLVGLAVGLVLAGLAALANLARLGIHRPGRSPAAPGQPSALATAVSPSLASPGHRRRISDTLDTLQRTAMQTHVLAVHAAVRSARAGGPDNGSVDMANEAALLAQRSAQAAREIQALLGAAGSIPS